MYVCFEIGKIICMYVVFVCMYIWMYVCRIDVRLADR
jgi:hypothetical protein